MTDIITLMNKDSERIDRLVSDLLSDGWKPYSWWDDTPDGVEIVTVGMQQFWRLRL